MTDFDAIRDYMQRHRKYKREIKACLDSCDGNTDHARKHYFNLDFLIQECKKLEVILLVHIPDNFLQNQIINLSNESN